MFNSMNTLFFNYSVEDRILGSKNSIIDGYVKSYELAQGDVDVIRLVSLESSDIVLNRWTK